MHLHTQVVIQPCCLLFCPSWVRSELKYINIGMIELLWIRLYRITLLNGFIDGINNDNVLLFFTMFLKIRPT